MPNVNQNSIVGHFGHHKELQYLQIVEGLVRQ